MSASTTGRSAVLTNCCCDRENNSNVNIYLERFDKFSAGLWVVGAQRIFTT